MDNVRKITVTLSELKLLQKYKTVKCIYGDDYHFRLVDDNSIMFKKGGKGEKGITTNKMYNIKQINFRPSGIHSNEFVVNLYITDDYGNLTNYWSSARFIPCVSSYKQLEIL